MSSPTAPTPLPALDTAEAAMEGALRRAERVETLGGNAPTAAPAPGLGAPARPPAGIGTLGPPPIPGLEVVGRGVLLRPHQPYQLCELLVEHGPYRRVFCKEARSYYALPAGYEVNDSPPMPKNTSLNQVTVEESWDRFSTQVGIDTQVATGNVPFSVDVCASANASLRSDRESYYATRSSFVPLWMVYVPNPGRCIEAVRDPEVPAHFSQEHRRRFDEFFQCYGSHYVRGAWVGGKSTLVLTVERAAALSASDIQAGLRASLFGGSSEAGQRLEECRARLRDRSTCTVLGKGGHEIQLAAMSTLNADAYNAWLATVADNPQVIELDVAGIWTLVRDPEKADAIAAAYRESVTFEPIKAIFDIGPVLYFLRGLRCIAYDRGSRRTAPARPLREVLPVADTDGFGRIDEVFRGRSLTSPEGEPLDDKLFILRQDRVVRCTIAGDGSLTRDGGYPRALEEVFPGMPFPRVDAVLITGVDSMYFFYGKQYARFNPQRWAFDAGYPELTAKRWVGVTFDRLDAVVYWGSGKVYFFKGDEQIRYDLANYRADPGYPRHIVGNYVSDWTFMER